MKEEIWRDIPKYEGLYQISNYGTVKNTKRILKPSFSHNGYKIILLSKKGKGRPFRIHRLVAQVFIPNPYNKPVINHKDSNRINNYVENLEWVTQEENIHYSQSILNSEFNKRNKPVAKYDANGLLIETYQSVSEASRKTNLNITSLRNYINKKYNSNDGCIWEFIDKGVNI